MLIKVATGVYQTETDKLENPTGICMGCDPPPPPPPPHENNDILIKLQSASFL